MKQANTRVSNLPLTNLTLLISHWKALVGIIDDAMAIWSAGDSHDGALARRSGCRGFAHAIFMELFLMN
jgi:hypothetical protein